MSAICIIPARGDSRRIPRKNIRMFHGKPIIAYSIEAAKESRLFDDIWVSTDDEEIARIAHEYGARSHYRSEESARDNVGTQLVMSVVLRDLYQSSLLGYACCIYPTAPLMRQQDLYDGYCELKDNAADFAFSVGTGPLSDAGQFYWGTVKAFVDNRPLISPESIMIPVPETNVCDINTEEDWLRAEQMYLALKENK